MAASLTKLSRDGGGCGVGGGGGGGTRTGHVVRRGEVKVFEVERAETSGSKVPYLICLVGLMRPPPPNPHPLPKSSLLLPRSSRFYFPQVTRFFVLHASLIAITGDWQTVAIFAHSCVTVHSIFFSVSFLSFSLSCALAPTV